jgi:hypothetical protein
MANEFEFAFWPTPGAEKDPRVLRTEESACGDLVVARVQKMPNPETGDALATDPVYELTKKSREIRRWNLPANAIPVATADDELVFTTGTQRYSVNTRGVIRARSPNPALAVSTEVQCRIPAALKGSGYARCHEFPSLLGHKRSILAFQGPCT